jgi:hypothetical protein
MTVIGFQNFLSYSCWTLTGAGSTQTQNPPNGLTLTTPPTITTNYTLGAGPGCGVLYDGILKFSWSESPALSIGTPSIIINGLATILSGSSGNYGPTFISAGSTVVLRYNNAADELNTVDFIITNFQFEYDEQICFKEGTKILCQNNNGDDEYISIENLRKNDLVKTYKHGYKRIKYIAYNNINNPNNQDRTADRLYLCSKENFPELFEDLIITGHHSILVDNLNQEELIKTGKLYNGLYYITDDKKRLAAIIDQRTKPYEREGNFKIWHLALEHEDENMNYGIYANGLLVESCSIKNLKAKTNYNFIN